MQRIKGDKEKALTYFASPERATKEEMRHLANEAVEDAIIKVILNAVQGHVLILNKHRQILASDENLLNSICVNGAIGLRPGELLDCQHAKEGPSGCGTSRSCSKCGAVLTILASQASGKTEEGECSLTMGEGPDVHTAEYHICCTPLTLAGETVTALVLQDISTAKRREVLERFFIHDLRNILQGLLGYGELLEYGDVEIYSKKIVALSKQLNEEIEGQSYLMQAERGNLHAETKLLNASMIMEKVDDIFSKLPVSTGKTFETQLLSQNAQFRSDDRLLMRVLVNMVKNAFEAVLHGSIVKLSFKRREGDPVFAIWNEGVIPDDIALQIFKRSFTTKGDDGRGIGTYSMKLLGEKYLDGTVTFNTSEELGTEFSIRLPA